MKPFNNEKSFTLAELLVICGIIVILSAIVLPSYRVGERSFALQRSAHKLGQDLRVAQELSMSAKSYDCGPGWKMKGYGINLVAENDYYLLKARCESTTTPGSYDDRQVGEQINLEKGVKILSLTANPLNIFFYPPDPEVDLGGLGTAEIALSLKTDITKTKKIIINKAGLINVE